MGKQLVYEIGGKQDARCGVASMCQEGTAEASVGFPEGTQVRLHKRFGSPTNTAVDEFPASAGAYGGTKEVHDPTGRAGLRVVRVLGIHGADHTDQVLES